MKRFLRFGTGLLLAGLALAGASAADERKPLETALRAHIATLSGDAFGGREPGTEGETKTIDYIAQAFAAAGLKSGTNDPGNPWFAPVEIVETTPSASSVQFFRGRRPIALPADAVFAVTSGRRGLVENAQLLFVGHGDPLPSGADLAGRVVMLLDARADGDTLRDRQGMLLRAGAAAVITVLDGPRSIEEVRARRQRSGYVLASDPPGGDLEAFVTPAAARTLFTAVGADFAQLSIAASAPAFAPRLLPLTATIEATSRETDIKSNNVIGMLSGRRPSAGAVLMVAHWDGFGECAPPPAEDRICNGAIDNASGVATLIETARALAKAKRADRDIYFLATTGEEMGLLGAHAFAAMPPVPTEDIVAAFNVDSNALARAGDPVAIVGRGRTPLDGAIARVLRQEKRKLAPGNPAEIYLRRQDGWALLQHDIPTVMVSSSFADPARVEAFFEGDYHRPSDQLREGLDLSGTADDVRLLTAMGKWFGSASKYRPPRRKS